MLVLKRKNDEAVIIEGADGLARPIKVTVIEIGRHIVKLGIEADKGIAVHREEVWERLARSSKETHRAPYEQLDQWADDGGVERSAMSISPTRERIAEEQAVQ